MRATPWQVGFVSTILRALARDDRSAMAVWVARPPSPNRMFTDGVRRIVSACANDGCRAALAPWADDAHPGPREFNVRERGNTTLARFAERGTEVLVLVIVREPNGDAKLEDVRAMKRETFEAFGAPV